MTQQPESHLWEQGAAFEAEVRIKSGEASKDTSSYSLNFHFWEMWQSLTEP
jgi:hypothetical protein